MPKEINQTKEYLEKALEILTKAQECFSKDEDMSANSFLDQLQGYLMGGIEYEELTEKFNEKK